MAPKKILFVCLGNICRSPMAEGIFLHLLAERGLEAGYEADSAGTGDWHCGERPDGRALETASRRGVSLPSICRQVRGPDFSAFDLILAMDRANRDVLLSRCPARFRHKIRLMRDFDPKAPPGSEPEVPDPYYGGAGGFETVFDMLHRSCGRLIERLEDGCLDPDPDRPEP